MTAALSLIERGPAEVALRMISAFDILCAFVFDASADIAPPCGWAFMADSCADATDAAVIVSSTAVRTTVRRSMHPSSSGRRWRASGVRESNAIVERLGRQRASADDGMRRRSHQAA